MTRARPGSLRVVAGTAGGRLIQAPSGSHTRPTSDRVRQAMFNALESLGSVEGARVLDAFAGSGALAIEALSRGALHATLVDSDPVARRVITTNLASTGLADRARVVGGVAERAVVENGPWDLVLLDPPYAYEGWEPLLDAVAANLSEHGLVVIESDREIELGERLGSIRSRTYGGTVVTFAVPSGASQ